jgi:hypothetical protein
MPSHKKTKMRYLSETHRKNTLALKKELATMYNRPFSQADFERQVKLMQPNGQHKQRTF